MRSPLPRISHGELRKAFKRVVLITLALMAASYVLLVGVLALMDFRDAALHYAIATAFTLILAPTAAFPLFVMSDRLRTIKEELEGLLRIDGLTGLPNRRAFFERADEVFKGERRIALMMIDVDHFKAINDSFGHDTGDRVLRSVAQLIQQVVTEVPGAGARFAARIGGEEFAVLVQETNNMLAEELANNLILKISRLSIHAANSMSVTVSAGLARRRLGDDPDQVLRAADSACYRAKRLGRNQWRREDTQNDRRSAHNVAKTSIVPHAPTDNVQRAVGQWPL